MSAYAVLGPTYPLRTALHPRQGTRATNLVFLCGLGYQGHEVAWRSTRVFLLGLNVEEPEGSNDRRLPEGGPEFAGLEVEEATAGLEG